MASVMKNNALFLFNKNFMNKSKNLFKVSMIKRTTKQKISFMSYKYSNVIAVLKPDI